MRTVIAILVLVCWGLPNSATADEGDIRFAAIDIYLHSTEPVAAWQFELNDRQGIMKVVGVEKGESPAYPRVPYYDREAVRLGEADRIVIADYSLADVGTLPSGRTRIATVHLMLSGDDAADFNLLLIAATNYDGLATDTSISFVIQTGR